jgi:hypothetical protein
MTCSTCRDDAYPDTCGVTKKGEKCACCGFVLIATFEDNETDTEATISNNVNTIDPPSPAGE